MTYEMVITLTQTLPDFMGREVVISTTVEISGDKVGEDWVKTIMRNLYMKGHITKAVMYDAAN